MSSQSPPSDQQHLDIISKKRSQRIYQCPKALYELMSFMDNHLKKDFKGFSLFALCQGTSHKLRFNDPNFQHAFQTLTVKQRLQLYEKTVDYGIFAFGSDKKNKEELDQLIDIEVKKLLPNDSKQFYASLHEGFRSSEDVKIRIQKFKISARNHFSINLQNYILRRSKKHSPQCYIFEAINKTIPEKVRFSFINLQQEADNLPLIVRLTDLAYRSKINSMIVPDNGVGSSPMKSERHKTTRYSIGRLGQPETEVELKSTSIPTKEQEPILNGKAVIEFSRMLTQKQRGKLPQPSLNSQKSQIVEQLLQQNGQKDNQPTKPTKRVQRSQNIFQKVLQTQSDVKQPYRLNGKIQQVQSPISRLTTSQVREVKHSQPLPSNLYTNRHKNVFELMLPEFNLREFQPSISSKTFREIYMTTMNGKNNFTIYQHIEKLQRFKCHLILQNFQLDLVYRVLINQELLKKWNFCVDESQIKITLSADNCLICYEKHKRYSSWFKERDYLFMRHAFVYKGAKYIINRSIEHNSFIPFQSIQRGYIRHCVTKLRQLKQNKIQIIVDISVDHGGYLGADNRKQLNLNYLKQYEKLSHFLEHNKNNGQLTISYCDLSWDIDWIDERVNDMSTPKTLFGDDELSKVSEVAQYNFDGGNIELQSEDYFSVKDDEDLSQLQQQQKKKQFVFETTDGFEQKQQPFKKHTQLYTQMQQAGRQRKVSELQLPQIEIDDRNKSYHDQTSLIGTEIVLDGEGYCVLPQKYFKKKHPVRPKLNYDQDRLKVYEHILLKDDFVEDKETGILLVNKQKIDAQNNVLKFIMKTMRKNLLSGKSILSISLPVQIFREDSNTQRLCQSMTLGPYLLQKAAKEMSPLQRMKWSICFALSNSIMYFYIQKPFNPILGETYQGMINGCPVYAEQVSHHPPITSLYFVGRGYKVYASLQAKVYLHLNSGDGVNLGFYTIEFDDGGKIRFQTAPGEVSGFTIGDRKYRYKDKMYVFDPINCYFSVLNFQDPDAGFFSKGKWTYPDQMGGDILKVTPMFIDKFEKSEQRIFPKPKQIQSSLSKMQGRWVHDLRFDGKVYYDIKNDLPYKLENYESCLNSDARYREDLIYRMKNDLAKSQIYKEYLENKQRKDRKLREQYNNRSGH